MTQLQIHNIKICRNLSLGIAHSGPPLKGTQLPRPSEATIQEAGQIGPEKQI